MKPYLLQAAKNHHLPSSLCLVSEESTDLLNVALELVRTDFCEEKADETCPCCQCRLIRSFSHPDLLHITPEGKSESIPIQLIRAMKKEAQQMPYQVSRKIVLLDRAHRMTMAASNALLKILEEPPEKTGFILLVTNPGLLLPTIRSRCTVFYVPIPESQPCMKQGLADLLDFDPEDLMLLKVASILEELSFQEASEQMVLMASESGDMRWNEAALKLVTLLAGTQATFQNRVVLEKILLDVFE